MKIYDINCWVGDSNFPLVTNLKTVDCLIQELDDLGIEKAVVSSFDSLHAKFAHTHNQKLSEALKAHKRRLMACWVVKPENFNNFWNEKLLEMEIKKYQVKIIRLVVNNNLFVSPWGLKKLAEMLLANKVIMRLDFMPAKGLSHACITREQLDSVYHFAQAFPQLKIILCSQKLSNNTFELPRLLASCPGLYLDISAFQYYRALEVIKEIATCDKLLFGSNMPYFDAGQFVAELVYAKLSIKEKQAIASKNFERMLKYEH